MKENLVYAGEIESFTSLGTVNDELLQLERECHGDSSHPQLNDKGHIVHAHFGSLGVTGDILYPIIWEAVQQIEGLGLKVICIVADGASSNWNFFRMSGKVGFPLPTYKTLNLYA